MDTEKPLDIAVIGAAGLIGVRHTEHVLKESATNLVAIVDPTPAGQELAKKHDVLRFDSVDDLVQARKDGKLNVDAAIVATPNHTHISIGTTLIDNDISTLVEKPIAVDSVSAASLLRALEKSKTRGSPAKVLVGHHRRFNPYIRAAKKAVEGDALGKIIAFQGVWALLKDMPYFELAWRTTSGSGGPILTNLIHEIDSLRYLFGDIERVYVEPGSPTRPFEVEETVAMTLRFESGVVGTFVLSDACASPYNWESATGENPLIPQTNQAVYTILGTKGSLSVPELRRWHYDSRERKGSWTDPFEHDDSLKTEVDDIPPFTLQLRNFVAVHRGLEEPNCSGLEGTKSLLVVEAAVEALKTRKPATVQKPSVDML